jgi:hypothetical protein
MLTISMLPMPAISQNSAIQNLVRNGDFSNGLTGWTAGVLKTSTFGGYPNWGIFNTTPWRPQVHPFAYLDVPGGAAAYLESDPFLFSTNPEGGWALTATLWGMHDPTILQVQIKSQAGFYTLDSFETPKVELGQQPAMKYYLIPSNFTNRAVAVRFTCADMPPGHALGVFCGIDDIAVTPSQAVTSQRGQLVPSVSVLASWTALLFVSICLLLLVFRKRLSSFSKFVNDRFVSVLLLVLLIVVLNLKIWFAFQYRIGIWDGYSYLLNARRFLYGYDPYIFFEILRPPLVPYLINLAWSVTGENIYIAEVLQPIFAIAGAGVLYSLLKRMFGYKPAFIASLYLLSIPELFVSTNLILVHGEGLFFVTASVYFLWRAIKGETEFYPAATGALALATLARYTSLAFVIFFALVLGAHYWKPLKSFFLRHKTDKIQSYLWIKVALLVFVACWIPWLVWNAANVGGDPFASLKAALLASTPTDTQWYFYIVNLPVFLGIPASALLIIGLIDKKNFRDKARLMLLLWIGVFLILHSAISDRQTRFYIEWAPPLAAFVALGVSRLEERLPSKAKILGWMLIAIWLGGSYVVAVNTALYTSPFSLANQYGFIRNYDEFMHVVSWVDAHTNHTTIGATDIGPFLCYYSNRLFYDMSWIAQESGARGITMIQFMKQIGVKVIVVRSDYINAVNLYTYNDLILLQSFPDYLIFQISSV